jgi:hypothetical protein
MSSEAGPPSWRAWRMLSSSGLIKVAGSITSQVLCLMNMMPPIMRKLTLVLVSSVWVPWL